MAGRLEVGSVHISGRRGGLSGAGGLVVREVRCGWGSATLLGRNPVG